MRQLDDKLAAQLRIFLSKTSGGYDSLLPASYEDAKGVKLSSGLRLGRVGDFCEANIANVTATKMPAEVFYLDTGSIYRGYVAGLQHLINGVDEIPGRCRRIVYDGDIVYSTVRPNLEHHGIIYSPVPSCLVSTGFAVLHPNTELPIEYLYEWLVRESALQYLQAIAENSVSTYPSISAEDLLNIAILIPSDHSDSIEVYRAIRHYIDANNREIRALESNASVLLEGVMN